jgi:Domain of unknown function (DUF4270)
MALIKKYSLAVLSTAFLMTIIGVSCTKFDTTSLGSDILLVDNINTFADTLDAPAIDSRQQYLVIDSTLILKTESHVIGKANDAIFGNTDAAIYVQFKPNAYPFYFGNAGDTVKRGTTLNSSPFAGFDSAFICLSYRGSWGDTTASNISQTIEVRQISDPLFRDRTDTLWGGMEYKPTLFNSGNTLLGSAVINPQTIAKYTKYGRGAFADSANNQIRIKLDYTAFEAIFNTEDSALTSTKNGFANDSTFRNRFNGFEIKVKSGTVGNTLYYVNLADVKSRLEFHYHKTKAGVRDTVVQSFQLYSSATVNAKASSTANYVKRDYTTGSLPVANLPNSNYIFLQTGPTTTFANIKIPELTTYTNRIVHRAYLIIEEDPIPGDNKYYIAPQSLYLDLKDTSVSLPQRYKPIYFDLSNGGYNPDGTVSPFYFPQNNVDQNVFDGRAKKRVDAFGQEFTRYEFNITRYVQHILSNGFKNYDLRLFAPYKFNYPQYTGTQFMIPYFNAAAFGRVRLGSGTNPNHRMKLVVVYSNIK